MLSHGTTIMSRHHIMSYTRNEFNCHPPGSLISRCCILLLDKSGGAIGSIRFAPEIEHGANAGLINAIKLLEPVKEKFPDVSYADLFQMGSCRAIETAGGPKIQMKYGRIDAEGPESCPPEGNLPDAEKGPNGKFGGPGGTASTEDATAEGHLRKVFYRMGLGDEEIVALSGAHTFGKFKCPRWTFTMYTS